MCGLVGILKKSQLAERSILSHMVNVLKHRGPDDHGIWCESNIGLGHARLSIHDLSPAGHQPMFSQSQRFVTVFNGEIYNYLELKNELSNELYFHFSTQSDTELLINAIELWGIEKTLRKTIGMFAFAAWDRKENKLYLARDRFGEKPLYYGRLGNDFVFSSELKPIISVFKEHLHIDRDVLATYLRYAYVPTPYCIYHEMKKLGPGTYLCVDNDLTVSQKIYWSAAEVALRAKANPLDCSFSESVNALENQLKLTLGRQMLSDVPIGAFLSGGIDSSTVTAIMQSLSSKPIKTFSIGSNKKKYDESAFAKNIAQHLGTDHTELIITQKEAMDVIPLLSQIYDEPFADSSQIPTFLVSQLAKRSVTVALSGDGADEIFGGYNRYFLAAKMKKILGNPLADALLRIIPETAFDILHYLPHKKINHLAEKLNKVSRIAQYLHTSFADFYEGFCTHIHPHSQLVKLSQEKEIIKKIKHTDLLLSLTDIEWMMLIDTLTYLSDDIMTKVDRAAMAVSLETRAPFLDHHIFEFAWRLPLHYKVNSEKGKMVLREVLLRYVPKTLIERPKMGFGVPLAEWLRGGLSEWAQDLLQESKLQQQGFLDVALVKQYLKEHLTGKKDRHGILWNILMFQQWLDNVHYK